MTQSSKSALSRVWRPSLEPNPGRSYLGIHITLDKVTSRCIARSLPRSASYKEETEQVYSLD